jgi:hypothetical protein
LTKDDILVILCKSHYILIKMICIHCMERYCFIRFEREGDSLSFRGIFGCNCQGLRSFSESDCLALELLSHDEVDQLRSLKLMALREKLDKNKSPTSTYLNALCAHRSRLEAYLKWISTSSFSAG